MFLSLTELILPKVNDSGSILEYAPIRGDAIEALIAGHVPLLKGHLPQAGQ